MGVILFIGLTLLGIYFLVGLKSSGWRYRADLSDLFIAGLVLQGFIRML